MKISLKLLAGFLSVTVLVSIIALTAYTDNISSKSELVAIIEKPFTPQKLLEVVGKVTN